jgi:hypothetical protein
MTKKYHESAQNSDHRRKSKQTTAHVLVELLKKKQTNKWNSTPAQATGASQNHRRKPKPTGESQQFSLS